MRIRKYLACMKKNANKPHILNITGSGNQHYNYWIADHIFPRKCFEVLNDYKIMFDQYLLLEKNYAEGSISNREYTTACGIILTQYDSIINEYDRFIRAYVERYGWKGKLEAKQLKKHSMFSNYGIKILEALNRNYHHMQRLYLISLLSNS